MYNSSIPLPSFADIFIIFLLLFKNSFVLSNLKSPISILFNKIIEFLFFINFNISKSSSSNSLVLSNIANINSASFAIFKAFFTPISSIVSDVFLIPAVSIIFNGIPLIVINSSIVSLVVPSISLTIALSSFKILFNKEDLPAFGLPIIAVFIPSFSILPTTETVF